MDWIHCADTPLGRVTLASDGECLVGLWFEGQKHFGAGLAARRTEKPLSVFDEAERWLDRYFSGHAPDFTPPLLLRGTAFQRAVWRALLAVPYGQTVTYGGIAAALRREGDSAGPRAVGGAVGRNPVALIVPCHRVVGADGGLTGYAGGIERKKRLLLMEQTGAAMAEIIPGARCRQAEEEKE